MYISSRTPVILFICSLLLICSCERDRKPTLRDLTPETGITFPDGDTYLLDKEIVREGKSHHFKTVKASDGTNSLKLEITSPISLSAARNLIRERLNIIDSLYANLPSPYPGAVTKSIEYPEELKPQFHPINISNQEVPLYLLPSSERFSYGALPQELIMYKGFVTFLYSQSLQTLTRIDYFVPQQQFAPEKALAFAGKFSLAEHGEPVTLIPDQSSPRIPAEVNQTVAVITAQRAPTPTDASRYNVILIGFEPLGANHVGCYGYNKGTTPNLDRFAADSFLFTNAISPSSWTLPVFMSWFTSLYPSQHHITNKYRLQDGKAEELSNLTNDAPGAITLAEVLQQSGYRTAGFTGGAALSRDFGYNRGFDEYFDEQTFGGFDRTMELAGEWLRNNNEHPFFLFVQGFDVHGRFPIDRENYGQFIVQDYQGQLTGSEEEYWRLRNENLEKGTVELTPDDIRFLESVYDAKIAAADARFGAFIKELEKLGLLENSIIIVSSGSGNEFYEHQRLDHGLSLYDELIKVPFIIRVPGTTGSTGQLARTLDIMPTVLDLLDINSPKAQQQMQGTSLKPMLTGHELALDGFSETDYLLQSFKRAISTPDNWKFIVSLENDHTELYNLTEDPQERNNVIAEHGDVAYRLEQKLLRHLAEMKVYRTAK